MYICAPPQHSFQRNWRRPLSHTWQSLPALLSGFVVQDTAKTMHVSKREQSRRNNGATGRPPCTTMHSIHYCTRQNTEPQYNTRAPQCNATLNKLWSTAAPSSPPACVHICTRVSSFTRQHTQTNTSQRHCRGYAPPETRPFTQHHLKYCHVQQRYSVAGPQ